MPKSILYTGPVSEIGLKGPETGVVYTFHSGKATVVDDVDIPGLLSAYQGLLEEARPKTKHYGGSSASSHQERPTEVPDSDS